MTFSGAAASQRVPWYFNQFPVPAWKEQTSHLSLVLEMRDFSSCHYPVGPTLLLYGRMSSSRSCKAYFYFTVLRHVAGRSNNGKIKSERKWKMKECKGKQRIKMKKEEATKGKLGSSILCLLIFLFFLLEITVRDRRLNSLRRFNSQIKTVLLDLKFLRSWLWRVWAPGLECLIIWRDTDVSERHLKAIC